MQWNGRRDAGFATGRDALDRCQPRPRRVNAAAQRDDPDSVFAHYRRLVELRHTEPVVAHGDFTMLLPDHEQVYAFTRSSTASGCWCSLTGARER